MDTRVIPLHANFQLNTRLILNCFDGLTDEVARIRPAGSRNSMVYISLHLHDARHYLAKYVGVVEPDPFAQITAAAAGIEDIEIYPSLAEMRTAWMEISLALEQRFAQLSAKDLDQPSPKDAPSFPLQAHTILGGMAFLLHHEAYHIGQMGYLRTLHGLPAMSWHP